MNVAGAVASFASGEKRLQSSWDGRGYAWDERGNDLLSTQDALDPGLLSTQQMIGILDELDCGKFDFPEIDKSIIRLMHD